LPYFGYARKERKSQPREPISAKLMANFITLAGADRVLLLDLHADAIEGFFDVPTDHLTAHKILAAHIRMRRLRNCSVVAPDAGGAKRAEHMATLLGPRSCSCTSAGRRTTRRDPGHGRRRGGP